MLKSRSGNIKNYMIVLIVIFVIVSILTNVYFLFAINNISINSSLYQKIRSSKDLKADILPPRLYIVESYLTVQQLVNERDIGKIDKLLLDLDTAREVYFNYYDNWQENMKSGNVMELLESSDFYVRRFYQIYDESFILALERKDYPAMQEIANNQMKPIFEQHRDIINQLSSILEYSSSGIENDANAYAERSKLVLLSVYLISLFLILLISIIIFKKVSAIEKNIIDTQLEMKSANQRLETMVNGLKKFKHSFENTLGSINGFVIRDDNEGLRTYMDEIIEEKSKNEMVNYFKLDFIKNPAITGLIISKMIYAESQGVKFILKVRSEVNNIHIKLSHLCEILGILLDNAIEAAAESNDKKLSFKIEESEDAFIFEVGNSIKNTPDQVKMFEKNWTTKGENRGFGLWIASEIVNKYDNIILNTAIDKNYIQQDLLIFKETDISEATFFTDIL